MKNRRREREREFRGFREFLCVIGGAGGEGDIGGGGGEWECGRHRELVQAVQLVLYRKSQFFLFLFRYVYCVHSGTLFRASCGLVTTKTQASLRQSLSHRQNRLVLRRSYHCMRRQ